MSDHTYSHCLVCGLPDQGPVPHICAVHAPSPGTSVILEADPQELSNSLLGASVNNYMLPSFTRLDPNIQVPLFSLQPSPAIINPLSPPSVNHWQTSLFWPSISREEVPAVTMWDQYADLGRNWTPRGLLAHVPPATFNVAMTPHIADVPLGAYIPRNPSCVNFDGFRIPFSANGSGHVNLADCLSGKLLKELYVEPIFPDLKKGGGKLSLRLIWPTPSSGHGYAPFNQQFSISRATTAGTLAFTIAKLVKKFIEINEHVRYGSDNVSERWRVGRQGITINRLLLCEVKQVTRGSVELVLKVQNYLPPGLV